MEQVTLNDVYPRPPAIRDWLLSKFENRSDAYLGCYILEVSLMIQDLGCVFVTDESHLNLAVHAADLCWTIMCLSGHINQI